MSSDGLERMVTLPSTLLRSLAAVVGEPHVLTGDATAPALVLPGTPPDGIGALKAPWLPLARTDAERALFARIRSALDPAATLNPNVLPRLSGRSRY